MQLETCSGISRRMCVVITFSKTEVETGNDSFILEKKLALSQGKLIKFC